MDIDALVPEKTKRLLQNEEVQRRVQENIRKGREDAKVTIGRAAELFDIKPNKLRELDSLLKPERSKDTGTGQRQYSLPELRKLAVISELIKEGCTIAEIPSNIDEVWEKYSSFEAQQDQVGQREEEGTDNVPINLRIEHARSELFWRYYVSHALRLSLMLIREDIHGTIAGLVLPLHTKLDANFVPSVEDLPKVGESLVGWLSRSRSSHTFLTSAPSFEKNDNYYRMRRLQVMTEDKLEEAPMDSTLILLDRRIKNLTLGKSVVETIRRLLSPIYEDVQRSQSCFGLGMRDALDPSTNLDSAANYSDIILDGLAEMVVRLGGKTTNGQQKWRFCCILTPKDTELPMQQRSLVVRAKSKNAPHKIGATTISPSAPVIGLSLRAFQSGRIAYRFEASAEDPAIALSEAEGPIHSAIAVPVGGEEGQPVAVIYVASDEPNAFSRGDESKGDQRVLRVIGRMVEELLRTYVARQQVAAKLPNLITNPSIIDILFKDFLSENDFINDVETLLATIKTQIDKPPEAPEEVISFIAIDVDNQGILANKYGDQTMSNLSKEVGLRIQSQLSAIFAKYEGLKLYHIYADRFYLLLRGIPLDQVQEKARQLKKMLRGSYQVSALRSSTQSERPRPAGSMLELSITVRLGVTSYESSKLKEILGSHSPITTVIEARKSIISALDTALKMGKDQGGDVIISWDPKVGGFVQLSSEE